MPSKASRLTGDDEVHPAQVTLWEEEAKLRKLQQSQQRLLTRKSKLELDRLERIDSIEQLSDYHYRNYNFTTDVNKASAKACIEALNTWFREDPADPVTIVFDSPGGSVFAGLALYDTIRHYRAQGMTVNTHSVGMAASMGGILLQAGEVRTLGQHAYILIHEISSASIGSFSEMKDEVEFAERLQDRLLDILAERSTMNKNEIKKKWERKDWWLDADEALRLGFIDAIV